MEPQMPGSYGEGWRSSPWGSPAPPPPPPTTGPDAEPPPKQPAGHSKGGLVAGVLVGVAVIAAAAVALGLTVLGGQPKRLVSGPITAGSTTTTHDPAVSTPGSSLPPDTLPPDTSPTVTGTGGATRAALTTWLSQTKDDESTLSTDLATLKGDNDPNPANLDFSGIGGDADTVAHDVMSITGDGPPPSASLQAKWSKVLADLHTSAATLLAGSTAMNVPAVAAGFSQLGAAISELNAFANVVSPSAGS